MAPNTAAFFTGAQAPLEVRPVDSPKPGAKEVVVKAKAVAINPVDYAMQLMGPSAFQWLNPPCVFGEDVAGEVAEVGSAVTKVKVGDRVAGLTNTAFQHEVIIKEHLLIPIPASLPYENAAVMPLGVSVAVKGLFHKDFLNLRLPSPNAKPTGETVLIWGASTSVGSNAVQLAAAAGYEVITTASPANFELAKKLGASQVFDYHSPTIKEDLISAFRGKKSPGAFCNGGPAPPTHPPVIAACQAVLQATDGRKFLALTMATPPGEMPVGFSSKFVSPLEGDEELASAIFDEYLPEALTAGKYMPTPKAKVVGHGLESIQHAMDTLKKGVSATKFVVTL
ncbi:GroES (chaperonin 10)-like protein [Rhypophila decipiens]